MFSVRSSAGVRVDPTLIPVPTRRNRRDVSKGMRFGRWTVIEEREPRYYGNQKQSVWWCVCDCGEKKEVYALSLKNGLSRSCGCRRSQIVSNIRRSTSNQKHGRSDTKTYLVWKTMMRSIHLVVKEWRNFVRFQNDMGVKPNNCMLMRRNVSKKYSKENCVWHPITTNRQTSWTETYRAWLAMRKTESDLPKEWNIFVNFHEDMKRAPGRSKVVRLDETAPFSRLNCVWEEK